ncbi:AraC family transcriptional regulator [Mycobacterium frederiksbergense]|uniref:AraC family transcriptional regulator n=1 Tax=Mycolicibacterium frederiksbergense TaxID=117567 RepID=A0A6H0S092_9MYCO|nr:AraC family transcriptional regulator [Mycolicibacterium frederiksbergense]MCV7048354.1 AraC family transcriptional regulator [Mycolicibacterium frederiksbergense]QIV80604.1 AraC family transcriptional regulator [Mycolicibacterium frederiksbergense]
MTQDPESEARPSALVFDGATDSVGELRLPQRESELLPMANGPKMAGSYFSRRETVCTEQLSAAEHLASEIFTPHRLRYSRRGQRLNARLSAARIGAVTVGYLRYGADVELVNSTALDDYHINVPLTSHADSWCGPATAQATPTQAAVFLPGRPAGIKWAADCGQLCVKFSRTDLEYELEGLLGRPAVRPLNIAHSMDLTADSSRAWLALLSVLYREVSRPESIVQHPMTGRHFEQLLMHGFLLAQPHYQAMALAADQHAAPPPKVLRTALDLIEEHPERSWTTTDLAREVGISVRALQECFKRHVGLPPLTYLREVRLIRAHAELAASSESAVTVARVAMKWGFGHLGRFSAEYRRKFGVTPQHTLRAT